MSTANDRFKKGSRRVRWIAIGAAVVLHAALFTLTPAFELTGVQSRMELTLDEWGPPVDPVPSSVVAFDSAMTVPELTNPGHLTRQLPRVYPWLLWHHREPSHARVQILVSEGGRVRSVQLLEDTGHDVGRSLLTLARQLRFEPLIVDGRASAFAATLDIGVVDP